MRLARPGHRLSPIAPVLGCVLLLAASAPGAQGAGLCPTNSSDADAKVVARWSQTAAEVYATDHDGRYSGLSPQVLRAEDAGVGEPPSLPVSRRGAIRGHWRGYLLRAFAIEHGRGYVLRARAFDGHTYTVVRLGTGEIFRTARRCGRYSNW